MANSQQKRLQVRQLSNTTRRYLFLSINKKVSQSEMGEWTDATILFSALCMYDFADFNNEVPPFRKGEILDIVQCRDDLGCWAAMRTDSELEGSKVSWISKSYVQRLSKEMAEKLRKIPQVVRVYEYNAEQLYNLPVSSNRR